MLFSLTKTQQNVAKSGVFFIYLALILTTLSLTIASAAAYSQGVLSFERAITLAQQYDPWLKGNKHQQNALLALSRAVETLPDPKVSFAIVNLPTKGFDFSQEAMTQFKVGLGQTFPRGDTLAIKNQQLTFQSEAYPFERQDRQAKIVVTVGSLWLDAYRIQQSLILIEKNRALFEQLADITQASYSSALGKTRQQDIVRAQLELTRLDVQLDQLAQQKSHYEGQLVPWLSRYLIDNNTDDQAEAFTLHDISLGDSLGDSLVDINLQQSALIFTPEWQKPEQLVTYFTQHPAVMAIDKKIKATQTGVSLAQQKYKPQWGVNASYGYRDDDPSGHSRADFMSVAVTFDLPIFTENRQDQEVKSAIAQTEASKTEKVLLLRQLFGAYASGKGRLLRINDRLVLYRSKLLPQTHDQAEASLTAYTNDDGDFSEVVRAKIAVLNAEIEQLAIEVEQQKIILELNYLFAGTLPTSNNQRTAHGVSK